MGKLRQTVLILGEGLTEFYYFKSLCDMFKHITFKLDCPKHTKLEELNKKIENGIEEGYDQIFCIIDMDTMNQKNQYQKYQNMKKKYAKPINKPRKGISCKVEFFETHRCTELFFLYYFRYTSSPFDEQETLLKHLNKYVEYCKKEDFFRKTKGLHSYFERKGGSLESAIDNANRSMCEKKESGRDYTYSELGQLMEKLKNPCEPR